MHVVKLSHFVAFLFFYYFFFVFVSLFDSNNNRYSGYKLHYEEM